MLNKFNINQLVYYLTMPIVEIGNYYLFIKKIFRTKQNWFEMFHNTIDQMIKIGLTSIPIVMVTSLFSGMVASANAAHQMSGSLSDLLGTSDYIGGIVGQSVLMELAPVITGLVLSGRVGATIASEIGSMKVTEQIDALESLSINSVSYLTVPRIVAGVIMFPLLIILADLCGIFGGYFSFSLDPANNPSTYWISLREWEIPISDALLGLVKAVLFGMTITSIACYYGFRTSQGAYGVGKSAAKTVVVSCVTLIIINFIVTVLYSKVKYLL